MRQHRFIGDFDLRPGPLTVRDAALSNQLKNVFRLRAGDGIVLGDGRGQEAEAVINGFGAAAVDLTLAEPRAVTSEPARRVTLYAAVLKRENFEWVAEKAVEVGAAELVPVVSERTVKLGLREDRLRKIMREAAEQCGRGILPTLGRTMTFAEALADAARQDLNIIFELAKPPLPPVAFAERAARQVGVFIGPEGGWTDEEVSTAAERGFVVAGLGRLTLRAETAATVATFLAATVGE